MVTFFLAFPVGLQRVCSANQEGVTSERENFSPSVFLFSSPCGEQSDLSNLWDWKMTWHVLSTYLPILGAHILRKYSFFSLPRSEFSTAGAVYASGRRLLVWDTHHLIFRLKCSESDEGANFMSNKAAVFISISLNSVCAF